MRPFEKYQYTDAAFAASLTQAKLDNFEALWNADFPWVEEPNQRRGGWSGVVKHQLDPNDPDTLLYIKRQQNHVYHPWLSPKRGIPTFYREIRNILLLQSHGIPVVRPIFYAMRAEGKTQQAILVTQALHDYRSLDQWLLIWREQGFPKPALRKAIVSRIAKVVRAIHDMYHRHGALHAKHIFIRYDEAQETVDIRLIDMEVTRRVITRTKRFMPDLSRLYSQFRDLSVRDHYHFLQAYLGVDKLESNDFKWVHRVRNYTNRKKRFRSVRNLLLRKNRSAIRTVSP